MILPVLDISITSACAKSLVSAVLLFVFVLDAAITGKDVTTGAAAVIIIAALKDADAILFMVLLILILFCTIA